MRERSGSMGAEIYLQFAEPLIKFRHMQITFISDFICPWCYIGITRLDRIIGNTEVPLEVDIMPHLLYPEMPDTGLPKSSFAKKTKHGMGKALKIESEKEQIVLNYKKITRIPSSRAAHSWCAHINDKSSKWAFAKEVFKAHFENGQDISDENILNNCAISAGMSKAEVDAIRGAYKNVDTLEKKLLLSQNKFVSVVPSLLLPADILIPGLMEEEIWHKYINRAQKLK